MFNYLYEDKGFLAKEGSIACYGASISTFNHHLLQGASGAPEIELTIHDGERTVYFSDRDAIETLKVSIEKLLENQERLVKEAVQETTEVQDEVQK